MFNFQQCLDDLWEDRVCWWLGCDVWGFNCMMLQLLGYEWCSASCSDLWPIDDKLRQSSFDMSLACTCMSMCTEHMRGWWWLMVGRKNVLGYCSVLQHCYIENHRIQKTQFSAGMCVCELCELDSRKIYLLMTMFLAQFKKQKSGLRFPTSTLQTSLWLFVGWGSVVASARP